MHYRELSEEIQKEVGEIPKGYVQYIEKKFPTLLVTLYRFAIKHLIKEERFNVVYFK
jgi:hypothetical protein